MYNRDVINRLVAYIQMQKIIFDNILEALKACDLQ